MKNKSIVKIIVLGIVFLLLTIGLNPVFNAELIKKRTNEKPAINIDDDTEFYALITGGSRYMNKGNNIPKWPLPPIADWKLKSFYTSIINSPNWKEENIMVLLNEKATKQNITNALIEMSEKVDSNDIFIFSYQGHGSEVPDEEPFDEEDGTDEIICPYNIDKEDGEMINYLTDDELNSYFSQIKAKGIVCIFESCLSGGLVGEEFDVDKEGRVIIVSTLKDTIGKASFLIGFPMTFGLAIACNQDFMFHAKDKNSDGYISIEEAFNFAKPIIYAELSLYWVALWTFLMLKVKDPISALVQTFLEFVMSQLTAYLMSGHFLFNCPTMIDNYQGELPLLEVSNEEKEKTPPLPEEIWDDKYNIPWNLVDKKYWPQLMVDSQVTKNDRNIVTLNSTAYNGPGPFKYKWDFGDGNWQVAQNTKHAYDQPGTYQITLEITDEADRVKTEKYVVEIEKARPRIFSFLERFPHLESLFKLFSLQRLDSLYGQAC